MTIVSGRLPFRNFFLVSTLVGLVLVTTVCCGLSYSTTTSTSYSRITTTPSYRNDRWRRTRSRSRRRLWTTTRNRNSGTIIPTPTTLFNGNNNNNNNNNNRNNNDKDKHNKKRRSFFDEQEQRLLDIRLIELRRQVFEMELSRPPMNTQLSPVETVQVILQGLVDPNDPLPDAGFRLLLQTATPKWKDEIFKAVGVPPSSVSSSTDGRSRSLTFSTYSSFSTSTSYGY